MRQRLYSRIPSETIASVDVIRSPFMIAGDPIADVAVAGGPKISPRGGGADFGTQTRRAGVCFRLQKA